MELRYESTRGSEKNVTASQAIVKGLADDGGLFVPQFFPKLEIPFAELAAMDYPEVAYQVMRLFFTDFTEEELRSCIAGAYDEKFDIPEICRLREADGAWFLELFHGKTIAFKDMALSILPYLMTVSAKKNQNHNTIMILTATSGDTGKAALAGFADVPGTSILVFYPKDGVSPVQERQMVTQKGANTHVIAIRGNFDDAQTGVKEIFGDAALQAQLQQEGVSFSSANSINIGRLIPQVVYYVYAYTRLLKEERLQENDPVNIVVPTGNFGNILAAYYAKKIGLPVARLLCASNANKVLFDFFQTGTYDRMRPFHLTSSPSMDILVSSNLERLLFHACGGNAEKTARLMQSLTQQGSYQIDAAMQNAMQDFYSGYAEEETVFSTIRRLYETDGYVIDPHTAVGAAVYDAYRKETGDRTPTILASTASPFKFGRSVLHAIDAAAFDAQSDAEQFESLSRISGVGIPDAVRELFSAEVLHHTVVDPPEMKEAVLERIRKTIHPSRP